MMNMLASGTGLVILVHSLTWSCQGWLWFAGGSDSCWFCLLNSIFLVTCFLPTQVYFWIKWWMNDYCLDCLWSWAPKMNVDAEVTNHPVAAEKNIWWWLQLWCSSTYSLHFCINKIGLHRNYSQGSSSAGRQLVREGEKAAGRVSGHGGNSLACPLICFATLIKFGPFTMLLMCSQVFNLPIKLQMLDKCCPFCVSVSDTWCFQPRFPSSLQGIPVEKDQVAVWSTKKLNVNV